MPGVCNTRSLAVAVMAGIAAHGVLAQGQAGSAGPGELPLFAVEITVGSKWDPNKPAQEQLHFRDHSANLKRLWDAGRLVMSAR